MECYYEIAYFRLCKIDLSTDSVTDINSFFLLLMLLKSIYRLANFYVEISFLKNFSLCTMFRNQFHGWCMYIFMKNFHSVCCFLKEDERKKRSSVTTQPYLNQSNCNRWYNKRNLSKLTWHWKIFQFTFVILFIHENKATVINSMN